MSLTVKDTGGTSYPPIEAGTYQARCVGIVDLGIQHTSFQGRERDVNKVRIVWELPEVRIDTEEGNKPRWISKPYTKSLNEKAALRKDLDSWRGKPFTQDELGGFDLANILSAPCLLSLAQVEKGGNLYTNINSVSRVMRNMDVPALENEPFLFDMDSDNAEEVLETLPQWMRDEVKKSVTWTARQNANHGDNWQELDGDEDDLPF